VRAVPTADGPLVVYCYRALAMLAAGLIITGVPRRLSLAGQPQLAAARAGQRRVLELAQTDILTGLPNRAFFLERLHDSNSRRATAHGGRSRC